MSSLDHLLQTPPPELVADLKTLRDERAAIEAKEAVLEQLLDMLVQQGGEAADEVAALGASIAIGPLRSQIMQVFQSVTEPVVDDELQVLRAPMQIHKTLVARGNRKVSLDNVRVTMTRMAESGELERPLPNQLSFALPGALDSVPGARDALLQAFSGSQPK